MFAIDLFICRSDYWLMIYKTDNGWQFALYFPSKKLYCNGNNLYYSSCQGCLKYAKQVAASFVHKIAEL